MEFMPLREVHPPPEQDRVGVLESHAMSREPKGEEGSEKRDQSEQDGDRRAQGEVRRGFEGLNDLPPQSL